MKATPEAPMPETPKTPGRIIDDMLGKANARISDLEDDRDRVDAENERLRVDLAEALKLLRLFGTFAAPSLDTRDRAEALVRKHEAKL